MRLSQGLPLDARSPVIGHRFTRGLAPENTIEALNVALGVGVGHVEIDIGVTSDGVPVVIHDPCLNPTLTRTSDGAWLDREGPPVWHLTLADLQRYDVGRARPGSETAIAHPDQRPFDGARVPTLRAVLAAAPSLRLLIELKTDPRHPELTISPEAMADLVAREVEAAEAAGRVCIESFDWRGPLSLRGRLPIALLTSEETRDTLWWTCPLGDEPAVIAGLGATGWAPDHEHLDEASVRDAIGRGLAVWPWTVNEAARMALLFAWGATGVITDRPDLAPAPLG